MIKTMLLMAMMANAGVQVAPVHTAIIGATLIDGNGGKPLENSVLVVEGERIKAIGTLKTSIIPEDAVRINASNQYLLPGFVDANIHASVYGNARRRETVVKYADRLEELVLEFAQRQLKYGVTTIRDSYGALPPLIKVRDKINRQELMGPRMLVAGNILGWGGPFSLTFSLMPESELTFFQQKWNDFIAQGAGEELMDMEPEELRGAVNRYLDKGPDFIKYGGTSHFGYPSLIGFSPRAQRVIVEETHKRNLIVETHATSPEALHMALEAGIDLIQHPEILSREYSPELLRLVIEKGVICALRSNTLTGEPWKQHLQQKKEAEKIFAAKAQARTSAERRRRLEALGRGYEIERHNAEKLIKAGCTVVIATDNYQGNAPEFRDEPKPQMQEAGIGSILAIEGLVELGMSEMQALMAATRNGAIAAGRLDEFGTLEVGKSADLLLLKDNPLKDIRNIRKLTLLMMRGRQVDVAALPEQRIFYTE